MPKRKIHIDGPEPLPAARPRRRGKVKTPSKRGRGELAAVRQGAGEAAASLRQMLDSISTSTAEILPIRTETFCAEIPRAEIHGNPDAAAYAKALMKIKVPVAALLVERRLPLDRILRIAPGTVLKFDRSCAQPLELEVGGRRIAVGEAVTMGEQLGLRITALIHGREPRINTDKHI